VCRPGPALPRWYSDGDHDGYGAPGAGICSNSPPPGTSSNDDDCCDSSATANPAQYGWFEEPYVCVGASSFDYDCDGTPEPQWTGAGSCVLDDTSMACVTTQGWDGPQPPCGMSGDWIRSCTWMFFYCEVGETETVVQPCH
jgi:hypothetical protein